MPGTLVHDAGQTKLLDAADITSSTTGSAVQVNRPGLVRFAMTTAAVTGTNPTLAVEIQASDASNFGSGVVSLGLFHTMDDTGATSAIYLTADCQHKYVRAKYTIGGTDTPTFNDVTVTIEELRYKRTKSDTADGG